MCEDEMLPAWLLGQGEGGLAQSTDTSPGAALLSQPQLWPVAGAENSGFHDPHPRPS